MSLDSSFIAVALLLSIEDMQNKVVLWLRSIYVERNFWALFCGMEMVAPFAMMWLHPPTNLPSEQMRERRKLLLGVIGNLRMLDRHRKGRGMAKLSQLPLRQFMQICASSENVVGNQVSGDCTAPRPRQQHMCEGEILAIETHRLLEMDSHEKIEGVARRLVSMYGVVGEARETPAG
jgi:hypothetical protein